MAPKITDEGSFDEHDNSHFLHHVSNDLQFQWKSEYKDYDTKKQSIYVNGHLKAPACPDENRKPVDIVIVLDRSGSMDGEKLNLCLKTIQFLIEELSHQDRLSLVTYDTSVRTDIGLTKMDENGKFKVQKTLKKITSGRSTNLSGGLLQGLQEIQSDTRSDGEAPNPVKSVLLLTDGLANHGITSTKEMVQMVEGALHSDVSLFTFGYGSDHNVDMLRQISEIGRGVYYFVKDVDDVTVAFANCLGGLLSVVAQNIKIDLCAMNGSEIVSIKTKKKVTTIKLHKHYEVEMGDLYGEEERDLLLVVQLPNVVLEGEENKFELIKSTVTYANILSSSLAKKDSQVVIERNEEMSSNRTPESHVVAQKNRILAADAIDEAAKIAEEGKIEESKLKLLSTIQTMEKTRTSLAKEHVSQTKYFIDSLQSFQADLKGNQRLTQNVKNKMASSAQMHYGQRANMCQGLISWDDDSESEEDHVGLFSAPSGSVRAGSIKSKKQPPKPTPFYSNKAKSTMMAKARKFNVRMK